MAQPQRKRDRAKDIFRSFLGRTNAQTIAPAASGSSSSPVAASPPAASNAPSTQISDAEKASRRLETLASIRAIADMANNVCDGCPIWGPKAAAAATSQAVKMVQTSIENSQNIDDVVEAVDRIVKELNPTMPVFSATVSPDVRDRITNHVHKLGEVRKAMEERKKVKHTLVGRLLIAEQVSKELASIMSTIRAENELFLIKTTVSTEDQVHGIRGDLLVVVDALARTEGAVARTEGKVDSIREGVDVLKMQGKTAGVDVLDIRERELLACLRPVKQAFHDAANASEPCMEGTRQDLLAEITAWLDNTGPNAARMFWLNGLAGTGKTAVAQFMARLAQDQGRLGATFFFSRNIDVTREPAAIIPTLAYQLARYQRMFRSSICTSISSDEDVRDRAIATQAKVLLGRLSSVPTPSSSILVVIDALDESHLENGCEGGYAIPSLVIQLASVPFVKILLTSRAEDTIRRMLASLAMDQMALHDIESSLVRKDIHLYLAHSFKQLAIDRKLDHDTFPASSTVETLVDRADKLFIYAATVFKWVSDAKAQPVHRLTQVLTHDASGTQFQHKQLDNMYLEILKQAAKTSGDPFERELALGHILSAVVLLQEPVVSSALGALAGEAEHADTVLPLLSSVLLMTLGEPVRLFHASFPDFLVDGKRCRDERFLVTRPEGHLLLAIRCLDIMNVYLQQDICGIQDPGLFNNEISGLEQLLEAHVPPELRYACKYWHFHLRLVKFVSSTLLSNLETFCKTHLLHWVEVLSLLGEMPSALTGFPPLLTSVRAWDEFVQRSLDVLLADTQWLIFAYQPAIEDSALHVYYSAAVTMPVCLLWTEITQSCAGVPMLQSPRPVGWSSQLRVLEGCDDWVAYSPIGQYLISCSNDSTVRVWDATAGLERHVMDVDGYYNTVYSVAYSPDGRCIVSGSYDNTIRVWDATTGLEMRIMKGCSDGKSVLSVSYSPGGQYMVSGSDDNTVRVWDATTGTHTRFMTGHSDSVWSVAYSPDGQYIVSGSDDKMVRVWDATTGAQKHTMEGHNQCVVSVAYSPDGQNIVSGALDNTVRVWDATTGAQRHFMKGHNQCVVSVAYSPNGQNIVSEDHYADVRVWDAATGAPINHIKLGSVSATKASTITFSLSNKGWISCTNARGVQKRLCWLPKERRGRAIAFRGSKVCIGAESGMLTLLDFSDVISV